MDVLRLLSRRNFLSAAATSVCFPFHFYGISITLRSCSSTKSRSSNCFHHNSIGKSALCTVSHMKMQPNSLKFDNQALKLLPIDPEKGNRQRKVEGACFSLVEPTPVENPFVVAFSDDALKLIDIDSSTAQEDELAEYFSGNKLFEGSETAAHCYCGHQFGYFSGQLGDGCAIYLGEVINKMGERWEIQLKGAGKTPYSRQADGRKVLRSSIREFLCSEAMYSLGIPTTRAGTCVTSDTKVIRDIFYNGNPIHEKATIVLRIAPTFLRFGSFEIFKPVDLETMREGPSVRRKDILDQLLDYTIRSFYPEVWSEAADEREQMLLKFYEEVLRRTARLVAKWQCIGWCHGVLNTDNMSIAGLTIDYGPYGFLDRFDPGFICNGSDDGGRYSYENQPEICRWNCVKLAEAIKLSLPLPKSQNSIKVFDDEYDKSYISGMRQKFGLFKQDPDDIKIVTSFLNTMFETGCDFTNGFRCLSELKANASGFQHNKEHLVELLVKQCASHEELLKSYKPTVPPGQIAMFMNLLQQHPELAEALGRQLQMITKEIKKQERRSELQKMTSEQKTASDKKLWSEWLDGYIERLSKELSGVSDVDSFNKERCDMMNKNNPRIVLRNYMAQEVIEQAESGDYSGVRGLLKLLRDPYGVNSDAEDLQSASVSEAASVSTETTCSLSERYRQKPPVEALGLIVT